MSEFVLTFLSGTFFVFWFAALGACFGSFLNVVVWRMPRNKPIVFGGSHCPKCEQPIQFRDNIPIFGWIILQGRCRNCSLPISSRYPVVEAITATFFGLFFLLTVIAHGVTLPPWYPNHLGNWFIELPGCELLQIYFRHVTALYFLYGIALMDFDRKSAPWRYVIFAGLVAMSFDVFAPTSQPLPVLINPLPQSVLKAATLLDHLQFSTLNLALSILIAGIASLARADQPDDDRLLFKMLTLIGLFFHWQVAALVCLPLLVLSLLKQCIGYFPLGISSFVAIIFYLITWRLWDQLPLTTTNPLNITFLLAALSVTIAMIAFLTPNAQKT